MNSISKRLIAAVMAVGLLIAGMVFFNLHGQLDPGFRFKHTQNNLWEITQSNYDTLPVGTQITAIRVDGENHTIEPFWLQHTVVTFKTDAQFDAFIASERFLLDAVNKHVALVDINHNVHPIHFKPRSLWNTSAYFWFHPLLVFFCFSLAFLSFVFTRSDRLHFLPCFAAIFYYCSVMCAISAMDRLWAVSADSILFRFALGNLSLRLFVVTYVYLLWIMPYRIGKKTLFAYIPLVVLVVYLATWLSQFSGWWRSYDLLVIKVVFVGGIAAFLSIVIQWWQSSKGKYKTLINRIALRWMLTTIGVCVIFGFGYNILWQYGYANGQEADLINSAMALLVQMGITAVLLKHWLYRLEAWWWRAWALYGGVSVALCVLILSAEFVFGYSSSALWAAGVALVVSYLLIGAYFRYRDAKYNAKVMARSVPELVKVATSIEASDTSNALWANLLMQTFDPLTTRLIASSAHDEPARTPARQAQIQEKVQIHGEYADHTTAVMKQHQPQVGLKRGLDDTQQRITQNLHAAIDSLSYDQPVMILQDGEQLLVHGLSNNHVLMTGAASGKRLFTKRDIDRVVLFWEVASKSRLAQQAFVEGKRPESQRMAAALYDAMEK